MKNLNQIVKRLAPPNWIVTVSLGIAATVVTTVLVAYFDLTDPDSSRSIVQAIGRALKTIAPWAGWLMAAAFGLVLLARRKYVPPPVSAIDTLLPAVVEHMGVNWRLNGIHWRGYPMLKYPECPEDETPLMVRTPMGIPYNGEQLLKVTSDVRIGNTDSYGTLECLNCRKTYTWSPPREVGDVVDEARAKMVALLRARGIDV